MANPSLVFVLTDGPRASKTRYYTDISEAAKGLAAPYGWRTVPDYSPAAYTGSHKGPFFGEFTAMFMDRPGLDLTDLVLRITAPMIEELHGRKRGVWRDSGPLVPHTAMSEKDFDALRRRVREELKIELALALENYLTKGIMP